MTATTWTFARSQAELRALLEMEDDVAVRAQFQHGLDANAASAARFIASLTAMTTPPLRLSTSTGARSM